MLGRLLVHLATFVLTDSHRVDLVISDYVLLKCSVCAWLCGECRPARHLQGGRPVKKGPEEAVATSCLVIWVASKAALL